MMLFFIGQKDEAIKLVKTSLSFDIKSTITWHSYGIINKYDHNFEESSKCLRQALKFDPENTQILMELGSLQVHIRDYQNAAETRHKLLKLRSGQRQIWIAYIIALELSKQTSSASAILKAFVESIEEKEDQTSGTCANSYSGILLFQIQLYILESNYKEALKIIETRESSILDKFKLFELKLTIYMNSKNVKSALKVCIHLIKLNPDNQKYYRYLGEILPTNSSQISLKIALYFHNMFPRAIYPAIYLLEHCESGNFLDIFEDYAKKAISKGQPNLFSSLKFLYSQTSKVKIIESFMFRILNDNNFESHSLWVWYYLGQHFNHINNYERALEFSDTAVTHNPTFIDGYVIRGQIYKNMGNIKKLIETISIAHALDEADRNINSIFANVLIKYHELKQAEDLMSIYTTKPNSFWDYMKDIHCIWLFQKTSKMYFNKSDFKKTLNICMIFENLYKTFENDPMDFHMYCMRKGTFNSYSNLCHDSWKLRDNIMYFKVARVAVKALLISLIIGSEANIHKNSFIDSNETIKTFISPLLLFDKNIKNYYLAFEYYYLTKKVLLMLKVLLPLIKYEPSNPKTIFNYIRFLNFCNLFV
ncbi:hypothetical protein HZS_645 [Henneguya salminicola]|nr:hypothetical protein HZS_645 [Henneguya salminicola]